MQAAAVEVLDRELMEEEYLLVLEVQEAVAE